MPSRHVAGMIWK